MNSFVKVCFYYLRTIARIRLRLSDRECKIIAHVYVNLSLDYCNVLYMVCLTQLYRSCYKFRTMQLVWWYVLKMNIWSSLASNHITGRQVFCAETLWNDLHWFEKIETDRQTLLPRVDWKPVPLQEVTFLSVFHVPCESCHNVAHILIM